MQSLLGGKPIWFKMVLESQERKHKPYNTQNQFCVHGLSKVPLVAIYQTLHVFGIFPMVRLSMFYPERDGGDGGGGTSQIFW